MVTNPNVSAIADAVRKAANNAALSRKAAEDLAKQIADERLTSTSGSGK